MNMRNVRIWKFENIERFKKGQIIPYYGLLNGKIICEATAILASNIIQNSKDLVGNGAIYLSGFRTNKEYRGKGYFSKLFKYMINDLKEKGYTKVISIKYLGEAILFLMPYENYIVDIMCTLFGIVLILCLILRYKSRKG